MKGINGVRRKSHHEPKPPKKRSSNKRHFSESDITLSLSETTFSNNYFEEVDDVFISNSMSSNIENGSNQTSKTINDEIPNYLVNMIDNTDTVFNNVDNEFYDNQSNEYISFEYLKKFIESNELNGCGEYF